MADRTYKHNLLTFGFIMLWVRGRFWIAEVLLIINLFNLIMLYFRHSTYPRLIHVPIVSAPLAWTYVAILWDGAAAVNAQNLPARIIANIFIWGILAIGAFYILIFKDYTMGFELAILSLGELLQRLVTHLLIPHSLGSRPIFHKGHRLPVDLCVCHHGLTAYPDCPGGHSWCPRSRQRGQTTWNR